MFIVTYVYNGIAKEQKFNGVWEVKFFLKGLKALGGTYIKIFKLVETEISEEDLEAGT